MTLHTTREHWRRLVPLHTERNILILYVLSSCTMILKVDMLDCYENLWLCVCYIFFTLLLTHSDVLRSLHTQKIVTCSSFLLVESWMNNKKSLGLDFSFFGYLFFIFGKGNEDKSFMALFFASVFQKQRCHLISISCPFSWTCFVSEVQVHTDI